MSVKNKLNRYFRKIGFEIHGINYLHALKKGDIKQNEIDIVKIAFGNQDILIYDVGANKGTMSEEYLSNFKNCEIHAFEPFPEFADIIKEKFKTNRNVFVNALGIADVSGELVFNVNKSIDTSSFLHSKKTGLNSDKQVETLNSITVPVKTIEDYFNENNHARINLLKLDIQGYELKALQGAQNLLLGKRIDFIFLESYFIQQYVDQPTFFDISNFLISMDYCLQDLYHPIYGNGKIAWCDSLFVRNDFKFI